MRTYVRDAQGRSGIWFLSLDATRLAAVLAARAGYWLPYHWSRMAMVEAAGRWTYRCRRRWPRTAPERMLPGPARCDAVVRPGAPLAEHERDELAHFLTARYRLFSVVAGRLVAAEAEHPPWSLHHAEVDGLDQTLLQAAGLAAPEGDPLLHASPGVAVRIGMWHR